jgi:hypothetical protein
MAAAARAPGASAVGLALALVAARGRFPGAGPGFDRAPRRDRFRDRPLRRPIAAS